MATDMATALATDMATALATDMATALATDMATALATDMATALALAMVIAIPMALAMAMVITMAMAMVMAMAMAMAMKMKMINHMHHFPCTPDCSLEIFADWLEDHGIDPAEIRLLAMGWWFLSNGFDYHRYCHRYGSGSGCELAPFGSGSGCELAPFGSGSGYRCGNASNYSYNFDFIDSGFGCGDYYVLGSDYPIY